MGQEEDAHAAASKRSDEQDRVEATFAAYAADTGRRRRWAAHNAGNAAMREEALAAIVAAVGPRLRSDGAAVLDAGCGGGWWLGRLATELPTAALHGVDLVEARVDAARRRVPPAQVVAADVRELPYPDEAFDAVLLLTVLSSLASVADVRAAATEAARVLRPGGILVVWEPRVPTPNPRTVYVRRRLLAAVLGTRPASRSLTVLPPLARRLGPTGYRVAARLAPLRSHRLLTWVKPG